MSKHYLLDIHQTDPWAKLNEVYIPDAGVSYIDGSYVVRVSDDIVIPDTTYTAADLLTAKYAGMLANSGLFTRIVYDDMLDASGIDMVNSTGISAGVRGICSLFPGSFWSTPGFPVPTMQMNMVTIPPVPVVAQCEVQWELFTYSGWDDSASPSAHAYRRSYTEVDEAVAPVTCEVSWNNGGDWLVATSGELLNIEPSKQGTQLIVRFTRAWSNDRLYLGSWAVLF
jgi:hypothetical protein